MSADRQKWSIQASDSLEVGRIQVSTFPVTQIAKAAYAYDLSMWPVRSSGSKPRIPCRVYREMSRRF